jgi:hypothetical protein
MSIRRWSSKIRGPPKDPSGQPGAENPEQKRFSAVDIAGHGSAFEAQRLADPK